MKYKLLSKRYDDLEAEVMEALREEVLKSNVQSKYINDNVLKVNVFDYQELAIINGELTFISEGGHHYGIYCECSLEDLIDILNKL